MFVLENKDIISVILNKFNECNYEDIKCLLTKVVLINKFMYKMVLDKLQYLINFYKERDNFELLGHTEAIKSKDMKIVRYLDSKYEIYKYFIEYLNMKQLRLIGKYKFYELVTYLKPGNNTLAHILTGSISIGDYDYFMQNKDKFNIYSILNIDKYVFKSNDNRFLEYFNINPGVDIESIRNNKFNTLTFVVKQNKQKYLLEAIHYSKTLEMFKFIMNANNIKDISLSIENMTYIFCNDNNFEVFNYIYYKILKNIDMDAFINKIISFTT